MTDTLSDTAPGFEQPIAVLKHCHDRIRKELANLQALLALLPKHGADSAAQQSARALLDYFEQVARLHHADEEQDLLPMLQASAQGEDAELLDALAPLILDEHAQIDAMWQGLRAQLSAIADGSAAALAGIAVQLFARIYTAHMAREEELIAPMAMHLLSAAQMTQLGEAMQTRRGIVPASAPASAPAPAVGAAVANLRKDYGQASFAETDALDDPIAQFEVWFTQALKAQVDEPNAMCLSTADEQGRPSSRIMLIKQFDQRGFTFYTNYASLKGQQLAANPHAALLFFWRELERQIRIEGTVERTSRQENEAYFHSRPVKSQQSAFASKQSAPIADRAALERNVDAVAAQYGDAAPPCPETWGGFRVVPQRIEFWQGRSSRFHDRIVYTRQSDGAWLRQRLQP